MMLSERELMFIIISSVYKEDILRLDTTKRFIIRWSLSHLTYQRSNSTSTYIVIVTNL